ncbi:MAG: hypothetical protein ACHQUB_03025 [Candidatus Saccharimonadia bacterium]
MAEQDVAQAAIAKAQAARKNSVKTTKPSDQKLVVKVFSPYQIFYSGEAVSVSAINKTGPFDVLFAHANFFSLLIKCDVSVQTGYASLTFPINHGLIKVANNHVTVFVDV